MVFHLIFILYYFTQLKHPLDKLNIWKDVNSVASLYVHLRRFSTELNHLPSWMSRYYLGKFQRSHHSKSPPKGILQHDLCFVSGFEFVGLFSVVRREPQSRQNGECPKIFTNRWIHREICVQGVTVGSRMSRWSHKPLYSPSIISSTLKLRCLNIRTVIYPRGIGNYCEMHIHFGRCLIFDRQEFNH